MKFIGKSTIIRPLLAAIILITALALALTLGCGKKEEEVIKIGASMPLTGEGAVYGLPQMLAAELRIDEINKNIAKLQTKLQRIVNIIRRKATDYRREYERFSEENRPVLYLHIPYRFVLNTRVYYYDVLPIPQPLKITREPNGPISSLCDWWDTATNNPQPYNGSNTIEETPEPFELTGNPVNNGQEETTANEENSNSVEQEQEDTEEKERKDRL